MVDLLDCLHLRLNGRVFRLRLLVSLKRRSLESSSRLIFLKFSSSLSVFDGRQREEKTQKHQNHHHVFVQSALLSAVRAHRSIVRKKEKKSLREIIFKCVRKERERKKNSLSLQLISEEYV